MNIACSARRAVAALAVAAGLALSMPVGATASVATDEATSARKAAKDWGCPRGWGTVFRQNIQGAWYLEGFANAGDRCATVYNTRGNVGTITLQWAGSFTYGQTNGDTSVSSQLHKPFPADLYTWANVRAKVNSGDFTAWRALKW